MGLRPSAAIEALLMLVKRLVQQPWKTRGRKILAAGFGHADRVFELAPRTGRASRRSSRRPVPASQPPTLIIGSIVKIMPCLSGNPWPALPNCMTLGS